MMAFGATEEVPYDSSGRIIVPPMMRRKGQLDDLALFIGVGETFQIWNPKLFLADQQHPRRHEGHRPLPPRGARAVISPTIPIPPQDHHVPVLLQEVVEGLAVVPGETLVDGTFGAGGYTQAPCLGRGRDE